MSEFNWQCPICLFQVLPHCDLLDDCSMSVSESSAPSKDELLLPMDIIRLVLESSIIMFVVCCLSFRRLLIGLVAVRILLFSVVVRHGSVVMIYILVSLGLICFALQWYGIRIKLLVYFLAPVCLSQSLWVRNILQCVICLISCKHHRIVVVSVYRSPSVHCVDVICELQSIFLQLSSCAQHVILAGDFYINLLSSSNIKSQYCDILTNFQATQHILEPSQVCNLFSTLIDHIITSNSLTVSNITQGVGLSDHRVQFVDINMWPNFGKSTILSRVKQLKFSSWPWHCLKQRMILKYFLGSSYNFMYL